jgi:hypothetical protein
MFTERGVRKASAKNTYSVKYTAKKTAINPIGASANTA